MKDNSKLEREKKSGQTFNLITLDYMLNDMKRFKLGLRINRLD